MGKYLGEEDKTGKIAPGFRADLVLLSQNPLEHIPFNGYIEGVISSGTYYNRQEIEHLLKEILQHNYK